MVTTETKPEIANNQTLTQPKDRLHPTLAHDPAYYETVYPNYDQQNPPYKYQHYLDCLAKYRKAPFALLDLGCASGKFLMHARNEAKPQAIYGVDVNDAAIERAKASLPEGHFLSGSQNALEQMPPVDVISSFDVLEHIGDLDGILETANQKLMPDGLFMAVVPVYDGPLGFIVHALDKDPTHIHKQSRKFWVDKLSERFELLHWHGIFRILTPMGIYLHFPSKIGRAITPAILLIARKKA